MILKQTHMNLAKFFFFSFMAIEERSGVKTNLGLLLEGRQGQNYVKKKRVFNENSMFLQQNGN